ncbi:MAG: DUF4123 domain-containing protein [Myxococcota bacterium]
MSERAENHPSLRGVCDDLQRRLPSLYAVLDGSRIASLRDWLRAQGVPYQCLFQGEKAETLADEAPYLIAFGTERDVLYRAITSFHDQRAVTFIESSAGFARVRRQLRRLLLVRSTYGEVMYFRIYDPQVARSFLPLCRGKQLEYVFGDVIDTWLMEARIPQGLMAFRRAPAGAATAVAQAMVVR